MTPTSRSRLIPRISSPRRILTRMCQVIAGVVLVASISATRYVLNHPGSSVQQNVASWARNNNMGKVVDALEVWLHSDPPSSAPADSLATAIPLEGTATTTSVATPVTTSINHLAPQAIPPQISPALKSEGKFAVIQRLRGKPVIWTTSMRPLADVGSVVATVTVYDSNAFRTALFNGTETPGGRGWTNGSKVSKKALPALVAAFNGGFRFEHKPGGYFTEGRMVRPLKVGYATMAIDRDGHSRLGIFGEDIVNDGTWVTLRQNLPPIVRDGVSVYSTYDGVDWGDNFGDVVFTFRSAICVRHDSLMQYVAAQSVDIHLFARTLVVAGCKLAMELDINGTWPLFATFSGFGTTSRHGQIIDRRMGHRNRFITKSTKDFFALFDPLTLPDGIVK